MLARKKRKPLIERSQGLMSSERHSNSDDDNAAGNSTKVFLSNSDVNEEVHQVKADQLSRLQQKLAVAPKFLVYDFGSVLMLLLHIFVFLSFCTYPAYVSATGKCISVLFFISLRHFICRRCHC